MSRIVIIMIAFLVNGCSLIDRPFPPTDSATNQALSILKNRNGLLKTFKGIGGITIQNKNQFSKFRMAWAGEYPDRLRMIVLTSGQPIETIISDGKYIYIKSHTNAHKLIKKRNRNTSLEKLISIPVKTNDIISILSGRVPLCSYTNAILEKKNDNTGYVIELAKNWKGIVQKIFLDDKKIPVGFEMKKNGKTLYQVMYKKYFATEGFVFPSEISLVTENSSCHIKIDRSVTNPPIPQETFTNL